MGGINRATIDSNILALGDDGENKGDTAMTPEPSGTPPRVWGKP